MIRKNTPVYSLGFLPFQQKMAQKIMKMIQGDYIEKPDFALKSIGKSPLPQSAHCLPSEPLQRVHFSSGLVHLLLPGSSSD